jgi:hypothetical protein
MSQELRQIMQVERARQQQLRQPHTQMFWVWHSAEAAARQLAARPAGHAPRGWYGAQAAARQLAPQDMLQQQWGQIYGHYVGGQHGQQMPQQQQQQQQEPEPPRKKTRGDGLSS